MLASINGKQWKIGWRYTQLPEPMELALESGKRGLVKAYSVCYAQALESSEEHEAYAWCSTQDQFVKARGRKVSLTRLLSVMGAEKAERTVVWQTYHSRS